MSKEPEQAVLGGIRAQLRGALDGVPAEQLEELVSGIFDMQKAKWSYCPKCREKVTADFPDFVGQAKAIALLTDQALGKPAETKRIEGSLTLRAQQLSRTMPLSELSNEELYALADSEMSEEERKALAEATEAAEGGDWEPLRALGYENLSELSTDELRHRIAAQETELAELEEITGP